MERPRQGVDGAQGGHRGGGDDDQLPPRVRDRLYQTLHEPRHLHPVQDPQRETHQTVQVRPLDAAMVVSDDSLSLQFHEPAGGGDLAVRAGRLRPRLLHLVCHGALLTLRVEQPTPVCYRQYRI